MRLGTCIYCLTEGPVTDDHVPPQNLFGKPRPSDLVEVPSCKSCNEAASKDDEYFKLVFAMRKELNPHPGIRKILLSVLRSLEKPEKRGYANAFRSTLRRADFPGVPQSAPSTQTYEVSLDRLYRVISRTTQGLHFKVARRLVDRSCYVGVLGDEELLALDPEFVAMTTEHFARAPLVVIGEGVFAFRCIRDVPDPRITVWQMTFFEKVPFMSATLPIDRAESPDGPV